MKKIAQISVLAFGLFAVSSFNAQESNKELSIVVSKKPNGEVCFKVKNDTGSSVTLHTGSGTAPMNNGTQREFCMEEGKKLTIADKGRPGKVLITVDAKIAGKTFKLSDLM
ncbi:MAG: hypothetical protein ACK40K_01125 [Raineya sp.]